MPGLFHPFVPPTGAEGVTVKEVIFKCISSPPSTHLLQTVTTAWLPILSFSIPPINQQITAVTAAHCFPRGKQFKMNFNWPGLGIQFILCMSALDNGAFRILERKKNGLRIGVRCQKKSRQSSPLTEPAGQTKASTQSRGR